MFTALINEIKVYTKDYFLELVLFVVKVKKNKKNADHRKQVKIKKTHFHTCV